MMKVKMYKSKLIERKKSDKGWCGGCYLSKDYFYVQKETSSCLEFMEKHNLIDDDCSRKSGDPVNSRRIIVKIEVTKEKPIKIFKK